MTSGLSTGPLMPEDVSEIPAAFAAIGWNKPASQYQRYLAEQESGERAVLVARVRGEFSGYLTIVWASAYEPFRTAGIPEIADLNVLPKWRRQGIATRLMDQAEALVAEHSSIIGIGVGMDADYGPAQRMDTVTVDDALVLMITKSDSQISLGVLCALHGEIRTGLC